MVTTTITTPTTNTASGITNTSFTASWNAVSGVSNYKLYVSEDSSFSSHLSGYDGKIISGTTSLVSGLQVGKNYHYRLKSNGANADSDYSDKITANTSIDAPMAEEETGRTTTSFMANWSAVFGVSNYKLYVSEDSSFSSHLSGYDGKIISGTTSLVSGLQVGKNYYYRLKSNGANADSDYSNKITANTSIDAPTAEEETGRTTTSFVANWSNASGAVSYTLDVSTTSTFSSFLEGYNNLSVGATQIDVTGLQHSRFILSSKSGKRRRVLFILIPIQERPIRLPNPIIDVVGNTHLDALGDEVTLAADQIYDSYEWLFNGQSISNNSA